MGAMSSEYIAQRYANRKRQGLCAHCPAPARPGKVLCSPCAKRAAAASRYYYYRNQEQYATDRKEATAVTDARRKEFADRKVVTDARKKASADRKADILARREAQETLASIGAVYGISRQRVLQIVQAAGPPSTP